MTDVSKTKSSENPGHYQRVLLKLSGEALAGEKGFGLDHQEVNRLAGEIKKIYDMGVQVCVVVGGGNILRGSSLSQVGVDRPIADHMGMLATVINALSLVSALEKLGVSTRAASAIPMATICEPFTRRKCLRHLEKGRIVIFAAGTGNPYFTTDTAAALRASEMDCDVLLKGTDVDGVYSADPKQEESAKRYDMLTYKQVLQQDLRVMDMAAFSLAREKNIPVVVFSIKGNGNLEKIVKGQGTFTLVHKE